MGSTNLNIHVNFFLARRNLCEASLNQYATHVNSIKAGNFFRYMLRKQKREVGSYAIKSVIT